MGKNLQYKILLSLLTAGSISVYGFVNTAAAAEVIDNFYTGNDTNGVLEITEDNTEFHNKNIAGRYVKEAQDGAEYTGNQVTISGGIFNADEIEGVRINYGSGPRPSNIKIHGNKVVIKNPNGSTSLNGINNIRGAYANIVEAKGVELYKNSVYIEGIASNDINNIIGAHGNSVYDNEITIKNSDITITGNSGIIAGGRATFGHENELANNNVVNIIDSEINVPSGIGIAGGYTYFGEVKNNQVIISGDNTVIKGSIFGGLTYDMRNKNVEVSGNSITLKDGADLSHAELIGGLNNTNASCVRSNKLIINGWTGKNIQGAYNFSDIDFNNITWYSDGTVLNITDNTTDGALANTNINLNSLNFAGGAELNAGESMTIISNNDSGKDLGIGKGTGKINALSNFTAGVAIEGTGTAEVASDGNSVKYTLTKVKHTDQIDLVAENRAVAAAFVNQGTDLISDSLDTISRDDNYGVKTFAAVHGNRSKYDVNSDIKINGWSVIAGVGNADKFDNGSEFSWGVFYENGSGNYRTYNEFNNEFFRGDGSLVYNGGGIAARYTNKNGVYTEGSLRAGMLKSDMDNALRDGAGNFYGYESESAYYGAHIGIGKTISLSESSDLDIYGKFFHTYTEGDSFKVANDEFEFDSINSDHLRIGARITSNKENKFSTYYGLAYEYEFNGDADMTAQGLKAPTQSLQGSSVMAEVGFNYQPTPDSPWSFDLNMRGYAGERQGGSFNVQATYTF